jgi:hypothetical protein
MAGQYDNPSDQPTSSSVPEQLSALKFLGELFEEFNNDRRDREPAWNRWSAMYRGVFWDQGKRAISDGTSDKRTETPHKSQLYVNETKKAIVSAVSNVMAIIFQRNPPFTVIGLGGQLDDEIGAMIKQVVWYFQLLTRYPVKARRYITQAAIYGTTFAKVHMDSIKDAQVKVLPIMDSTGIQIGTQRQTVNRVFPTVEWDVIDRFDMWTDPTVPDHTKWGRGVFQRVYQSPGYIKDKIAKGIFKPVDVDKYTKAGTHKVDAGRDQRRIIIGLNPLKRTDIELFEFWGWMPAAEAQQLGIEVGPDEFEVPAYCLLIGVPGQQSDYLLARRNDLPGHVLPYIRDIWEDTGEGPEGRGIPENTQGPQMALNVTINTRLDNKATAIQQIIGVVMDALEDPDDLTFKQNWVIRFKEGMGDIRTKLMALNVPDITANSHIEQQEFERMIEEQSGILKFVQGDTSYGSNRTASGIATVFTAASKFIRDVAQQFEYNLVTETCRLMYKHILMYMPDKILVMITENPLAPVYRQIALQNIAADVDFAPMGVQGLAMREVRQGQMAQILQGSANPIDLQVMGLNGRKALWRQILEDFEWRKDIVDQILPEQPILPPPPPEAAGGTPGTATPGDMSTLLSSQGRSPGRTV